jgi:hypothetical protein
LFFFLDGAEEKSFHFGIWAANQSEACIFLTKRDVLAKEMRGSFAAHKLASPVAMSRDLPPIRPSVRAVANDLQHLLPSSAAPCAEYRVSQLSRKKGDFRLLQMTIAKNYIHKITRFCSAIPSSDYVPQKKLASVFVPQSDPLNLSLKIRLSVCELLVEENFWT